MLDLNFDFIFDSPQWWQHSRHSLMTDQWLFLHNLYIMMNGECVALIACMRARGIRTGYLSRFRFRLTPMVAKFKAIINDGLVIFFLHNLYIMMNGECVALTQRHLTEHTRSQPPILNTLSHSNPCPNTLAQSHTSPNTL